MQSGSFPPPDFIPTESAVAGIDVYMPKPVETDPQAEVVDFKCPQCGATTAYSVAGGGLTCTHCGYYEAPQLPVVGRGAAEFEFTVDTMKRAAQGWGEERKEMSCENCGATTSVPVETLAHTCLFCGSNRVIQRPARQDQLRPLYLIPFCLEDKRCQEIAREWLGSSWMTPGQLQRMARLSGLTAIYLPFWTFDATTHASWRAEVGHTQSERYFQNGEWKTRTRTVWRWESGQVDLRIDDLQVNGTARVSSLLLDRIKPYELGEMCAYEPKYLAGFQAQAYDVPLEEAWEEGRTKMREMTRQACVEQASSSQIRNFSTSLDFADESWRYVLLPVYLTSYPFEGKTYQVLVNGQTGTIAGQRPVDWTKVWLVIGAVLAPGILLGLVGILTILFGGVGVVFGVLGFILLVVGVIISAVILRRAQELDDA